MRFTNQPMNAVHRRNKSAELRIMTKNTQTALSPICACKVIVSILLKYWLIAFFIVGRLFGRLPFGHSTAWKYSGMWLGSVAQLRNCFSNASH